jgi:hypothetical protein
MIRTYDFKRRGSAVIELKVLWSDLIEHKDSLIELRETVENHQSLSKFSNRSFENAISEVWVKLRSDDFFKNHYGIDDIFVVYSGCSEDNMEFLISKEEVNKQIKTTEVLEVTV